MKDEYDKAVRHLTEHPNEIFRSWCHPRDRKGGKLFLFCSEDREYGTSGCGCLTQVKSRVFEAETRELTEAIRNDDTLPSCIGDVKVEHLGRFAAWQRAMDKYFEGDETAILNV